MTEFTNNPGLQQCPSCRDWVNTLIYYPRTNKGVCEKCADLKEYFKKLEQEG